MAAKTKIQRASIQPRGQTEEFAISAPPPDTSIRDPEFQVIYSNGFSVTSSDFDISVIFNQSIVGPQQRGKREQVVIEKFGVFLGLERAIVLHSLLEKHINKLIQRRSEYVIEPKSVEEPIKPEQGVG